MSVLRTFPLSVTHILTGITRQDPFLDVPSVSARIEENDFFSVPPEEESAPNPSAMLLRLFPSMCRQDGCFRSLLLHALSSLHPNDFCFVSRHAKHNCFSFGKLNISSCISCSRRRHGYSIYGLVFGLNKCHVKFPYTISLSCFASSSITVENIFMLQFSNNVHSFLGTV